MLSDKDRLIQCLRDAHAMDEQVETTLSPLAPQGGGKFAANAEAE